MTSAIISLGKGMGSSVLRPLEQPSVGDGRSPAAGAGGIGGSRRTMQSPASARDAAREAWSVTAKRMGLPGDELIVAVGQRYASLR